MNPRNHSDAIVRRGRQQLLDLRDALTFGEREPKVVAKVAMNDVFRYGFSTEEDIVQLTGAKKAPAVAPVAPIRSRMSLRRRILVIGQYPLIAVVAIGAAYSTSIGQWFILAYAILAVWRRIDSRYSFGAAIFLLVTVPLFQAIGQTGIAQNAAVYVFELLVIGTIQAIWELRKTGELTT